MRLSVTPFHRLPWGSRLLGVMLGGAAWSGAVAVEGLDPAKVEFFEKKVRPVLVERCYECHSVASGKSKGGLLMDSREALLRGGDSGPGLKPGQPSDSLIITAVRYVNQDMQMPPKGALPKAEVEILEQWVAMGAPDPRDEAAVAGAAGGKGGVDKAAEMAARSKHWSFQPVRNPAVPPLREGGRNAVDAFIQAKLAEKGLKLSPEADRRTLLRRVSYDLTGLPPTREEIAAFVEDTRPDAYERMVERLLNSPRYGEKWGRHWLDVARYADSNGLDENVAFGSAWRYRDYVVRAFNEDKPFDQFLMEQVAGDLMPSATLAQRHERMTATAFLNLGAKVLAEPDKEKLVMDIVDEQIDTLGKAFLGMTLGCARCHEHKFDPILQEDYYALAAIFKSTQSLGKERTGAISYWNEQPLAGLEEFAKVHAEETRLTAVKKKLSAAEGAARNAVVAEAEKRALDYLVAALELPEHATLTEAAQVAGSRGLHGAILLNTQVYLKTHAEEPFFAPWHQAQGRGAGAAEAVRAHYGPLLAQAAKAVPKGQEAKEAPMVAEARKQVANRTGFLALPPVPDKPFPPPVLEEIVALRDEADAVEKALPDLPTVMAVADSATVLEELKLHIRGNHMALGDPVKRGVPGVMQVAMRKEAPKFDTRQSGRLELARWLVDARHPLTARVTANRIWTWHFGQGIVATPDNFGLLGAVPSHPELLDWLAHTLVSEGWSVKEMHRLILNSATYRQQSAARGPEADLENRLLSVFPVRRLEAEEIRDTVLQAAGQLDLTLGGKTVPLRNRQFVFNHTSRDATTYGSTRRALYLPVIRNNLYELFQQFDYPDPSMPTGLRNSSVVAPQALLMLNSPLFTEAAGTLAEKVEASPAGLEALYETLFARQPSAAELDRCRDFLRVYEAALVSSQTEASARQREARAALYQTLLMANELIYVR